MAISPITEFMNSDFPPEKADGLLYEACVEAFGKGWTFMQASFQLGSRAQELGIDSDRVEHLLRQGFEKSQRKEMQEDHQPSDSQSFSEGPQVTAVAGQMMPTYSGMMRRREQLRTLNLESLNIPWPSEDWRKDFVKLLKVCFEAEDSIAVSKKRESKSSIQKISDLLADESKLVKACRSFDGDDGAWVRLNATSGDRETDLMRYKYVLIENRRLELGMQLSYFKALNLPCQAMVNVGGQYLQAWVKIDAFDRTEYLRRISEIQKICQENDFEINTHEGDPLAFASIPGSLIQGKQCYLMDVQVGASDFDSWKVWADDYLDGDPLIESAKEYEEIPPKTLEILRNMVRQSHKVVIAGAKNTGKSWLTIDMALAIANGRPWLDIATEESQVLYVNMELDSSSFVRRFWEVAQKRGDDPQNPNIDFLHLMGVEKNVAEFGDLVAKRVRGALQWQSKEYSAIFIDGISKLPGFDQSEVTASGDSVSLALALDKIVALTGAAVILVLDDAESAMNQIREDYLIELQKAETGNLHIHGGGRHYAKPQEIQCRFEYPCFEMA